MCLRKKVKHIFSHYWTKSFVDSFAKMKRFWEKSLDGTDLKNLLEYSNSKYLYFVASRLWLKVIGMFRSNQIDAGLSWRRQQNTFPLKGKTLLKCFLAACPLSAETPTEYIEVANAVANN